MSWRGGGDGSTRPAWCAVSPPNLSMRNCFSPRWRRCCGGCPRAASPSAGSPPNAAEMRTPWTTDARSAPWRCRRSVRWRACRSRPRVRPTPAAPAGPPREFTSTSCRRWRSASACPATRARPWAGRWPHAARRDSRRCSRSASSAAMTSRCAPPWCGSAITRWWSRPPPTNWAPGASRWCASAASPPPPGGGCWNYSRPAARSSVTHGDFDWGGVRIARAVCHRVTWRPWRYERQAYEAAVSAAHPLTPLAGLAGEPAATPWDPELAAAMRHRNVRIEEELTLDALLQDLSP